MSGACVLLVLLLSAPPPPAPESGAASPDLSFADNTQAETPEQLRARLEARTLRIVPNARALDLSPGDTVFIETEVSFKGRVPAQTRAAPIAVRTSRDFQTAPWAEVVNLKPGRATVRYAVRALPGAHEPSSLKFILELTDADKVLGRARVEHELQVTPIKADLEGLELDRQAYLHHQRLAREAYLKLPELKDYLRMDRVDRAPSAGRIPAEKDEVLQSFLRHRLQADVARTRLRAAADLADPELATAAALTLGGLSAKPEGPAARARAIEGLKTTAALDLTRRVLDDLQIDVAEGLLNKLRLSGRLSAEELAEALALQGAIQFLRGKPAAADKAYGGALCLEPKLECTLTRPALQARFQKAQAGQTCAQAVHIEDVQAERITSADGYAVQLRVRLSPDPHHVVSGGEIQLWGFGGGIERRAQPRAETLDGVPYLLAELPDDDSSRTTDRLLVTVLAKHVSGVVVASVGTPRPQPVEIVHAEVGQGPAVPTWVWWVAGGVALVGGATVGIWALSQGQGEVERGIGPVEVRF